MHYLPIGSLIVQSQTRYDDDTQGLRGKSLMTLIYVLGHTRKARQQVMGSMLRRSSSGILRQYTLAT